MQPLIGPLAGLTSIDSEVESLQTDVMRFLAIIGLCLLAVFAAVSSEMPQSARDMINVQENMIAALQSDTESAMQQNAELQSQLAQRDVELLNAQTQLNAQDSQQQLPQSDAVALALRSEISVLQGQLQDAAQKQTDLRDLVSDERQQRETTEVEVQRLQRELRAAAAELMAQREQSNASSDTAATDELQWVEMPRPEVAEPARQPRSPQTVDTTPVADQTFDSLASGDTSQQTAASQTTQEQSLTLSFESDGVLISLLNSGRVQLLALAAGSVWRYQSFDQSFVGITIADNVYMISQVPAPIGSLAASRLGQPDIRWGVVMDTAMRSSLSALISSVASGEILVNEHGEFQHRP